MNNHTAILVPAYNPPAGFDVLLDRLAAIYPNLPVIVVDDGSANPIVNLISDEHPCRIERHNENRGKGAALKTGFELIVKEYPAVQSIVTVDADGQHLIEDVKRIIDSADISPDNLIMGERGFESDVPFRSTLGNTIMRKLFSSLTDSRISDTQTGLRAYPIAFAQRCVHLKNNRYDFEMECLFLAVKSDLEIQQIPITTRYEEGNKSSHFRPLLDSMRVVAVFLRFLSVSIFSFAVDIAAFTIIYVVSEDIISSTYIARSISATINFTINKLFVFKSLGRRRAFYEAIGYISLAFIVASLSAFFVLAASEATGTNVVALKIAIDCLLFVFSFLVQKYVLFFKR